MWDKVLDSFQESLSWCLKIGFLNITFTSLQNVTKGARHKIVISIQKLKERQNLLKSLERVSYHKLSLGDGPFLPSSWANGPWGVLRCKCHWQTFGRGSCCSLTRARKKKNEMIFKWSLMVTHELCITWPLKCTYFLGSGILWLVIPGLRGSAFYTFPSAFYMFVEVRKVFSPWSEAKVLTNQCREYTYVLHSCCPPRKGSGFEKSCPEDTDRYTPGFNREVQNHLAEGHSGLSKE